MTRRSLFALSALAVLLSSGVRAGQQQPAVPVFRSSVELTSIDAGVFDSKGYPVSDLKPEDFNVRIDGTARHVVSAQWVPLETPMGPPAPPPPDGYSSNDNGSGGRLIVIVIDQPNIRFGGTLTIRNTMFNFIDRLKPADRIAVVGIGPGSQIVQFTANRDRVKNALSHMAGQHHESALFNHGVGLAEALDIARGAPAALMNAVDRECRDFVGHLFEGSELQTCQSEVMEQALTIAQESATDGRQTIAELRALLVALRVVDAPKSLLLVSEGFVMDNSTPAVVELASLAAAARTSIYGIKLDSELFNLAEPDAGGARSTMNDRAARAAGLEVLAVASRGTLFNVIGQGTGVFDRIQAELSGYYLIGVESGPTDRDGKIHPLRVDVSRQGATVRARRALLAASDPSAPRPPRMAVAAALASPLPVSGLQLRVATYALQGPETNKVQLYIHADIGAEYIASKIVSLGYILADKDGHIVESQAANERLAPVMRGVPSPLQLSVGASIPPGDYELKLVVAEGDRVGTVEHPVHAVVSPAGRVTVSDLMVGGPANIVDEPLQPTVGYSVAFGALHGYLEAYGEGAGALMARFEIASDAEAPAILEDDVLPRLAAGGTRAIFSKMMPVRQLPPGKYFLRATLYSAEGTVKTATRTFEVASPAVLMTSASEPGADATVNEVYLPVPDALLSQPFSRAEVSKAATVRLFRDKVPTAARPAFDHGVQALADGSYLEAETALKSAINPDADSSPILAYLAAVYAASGHDTEAAGAWQTALIDGSDVPEVYDWLAGSLLRSRDMTTARAMLEEAAEKWPTDPRFSRPIALVYATFGMGVQAFRSLERYLTDHRDDADSLFMGVEWLYQLHAAGVSAHSPADDAKLAKTYADAYAKAKGQKTALVKQWIDALETKSR